MRFIQCLLLVSGVSFGYFNFSISNEIQLDGTSEFSFNDKFKILKTAKSLVQLKSEMIDLNESVKFNQLGAQISIIVPTYSIESIWTLESEQKSVGNNLAIEKTNSAIYTNANQFILIGEILPNTTAGEAVVQIGNQIFRIQKSALLSGERAKLNRSFGPVILLAPEKAILSRWNLESNLIASRAPAESLNSRSFEKWDDFIRVNGTVAFSFDDREILIQSENKCVVLNRAKFSAQSADFMPGTQVSLLVPQNNVIFKCAANDL